MNCWPPCRQRPNDSGRVQTKTIQQSLVDCVHFAFTIDNLQQAGATVVLDQWFGLLLINLEAVADGLLVVVGTLNQFPTGIDAGIDLALRREIIVNSLPVTEQVRRPVSRCISTSNSTANSTAASSD